ncbi:MAG: NAD(P)-dependent oxidoreductase [Rhodobacteraceae bacterium]|nr:NAD(P)-dependent oxidoreductase [Paracoccaceae bacterium]
MSDATRTAVVGLGQMGRGIARNLDAKSMLVAASDTRPEAFLEAGLSDRVAEVETVVLLNRADIVLFAVPSTTQIATFLGKAKGRSGQVVVDLTTSDPEQGRALAADLAMRDLAYVDAAMTGGAVGADTGTLTLMIGGEVKHVAACRPVLEAISAKIFHLGEAGAGQAMKLAHNLILHSSFLATCEGLQLAERAGIDPNSAVEVLNAGNARSFVTQVRFPRDILSGTMNARSRIANLEKDLSIALGFAAETTARVPFCALTHRVLAEALTAGHSDTDFSWLFPLYEEMIDRLEVE